MDEYLDAKEKEERNYTLDMYKDKQQFRMAGRELKKEREDDELYHELTQNVIIHYPMSQLY